MSEQQTAVVQELRRARTQRRLGDVEWFDIAYRVYLFALVGGAVVVWASDIVEGLFDEEIAADLIVRRAPSLLGVTVALAVAIGLRNGAEGGPVSIEEADVRHLLLAPIPRRVVLARPVGQRLRAAAFALALGCGIVGQLVATELPGSRAAWAASGALFGALVGVFYVGTAVLAHVARLPRWLATIAGAVLVGWQGVAAWLTWFEEEPAWLRAGPANLVGSVAVWGIRQRAIDVIAIVVAVAVAAAAVATSGRLRSERLQYRARLVSQLRFAATVQDLRTVVLLRRQLRAERLRNRPWGAGRASRTRGTDGRAQTLGFFGTMTRRGSTSIRRLPAPRLARIVALAIGAGVAAALTVTSSVLFAGALVLVLFVLGLEALEPLSQEIDRPSRTDALPVERGRLYAAHLIAPGVLLAIAGLIGATGASVVEPRLTAAAFALAIPTVWAGAIGAVVTTVSDAPPLPQYANITLTGRDKSDQSMTIPPEFAGFATTFAVLIPLGLSAVAALPLLLLRSAYAGDGADPIGGIVRSGVGLLLVVAAAVAWVVWRDRVGTRVRRFFVEGREQYAASGGRLT